MAARKEVDDNVMTRLLFLTLAIVLALLITSCSDEDQSVHAAPAEPLEILQLARDSAFKGHDDKATEYYIRFLDLTKDDQSFQGVRLSFATYELVDLASISPSAFKAVAERTEMLERQIGSGNATIDELREWYAFSQAQEFPHSYYAGMLESVPRVSREAFISVAWPTFVEMQMYDVVVDRLPLEFDLIVDALQDQPLRGHQDVFVDRGVLLYEALVAAGDHARADRLLEVLTQTHAPASERLDEAEVGAKPGKSE